MKRKTLLTVAVIASITLSAFAYNSMTKKEKEEKIVPESMISPALQAKELLPLVKGTSVDDLVYNVGTRFNHHLSLSELQSATSFLDLIPEEKANLFSDFSFNKLARLDNDGGETVNGEGKALSPQQLNFIKQLTYSDDFYLNADCHVSDSENGHYGSYDLVYYITITPEKTAQFEQGETALIQYLKGQTKNQVFNITKDQLRPGRFRFTVTKEGNVNDVMLESSCGYNTIDLQIMQLLDDLDGQWKAAENKKGETVDQELVFFFGMRGC